MTARSFAFDSLDRTLALPDRIQLARTRRRRILRKALTFSLPLATYRRDQVLLERTVPSILNQTYSNFEINVVHDGPAPELRQQIADLRDPRISFQECRRPKYPLDPVDRWMCAGYRARNLGLRASRGDWIYWMSDDDILLSNALETLADAIKENESSEIVYGDYLAWEEGRYIRKTEETISQSFPMTGIPALAVRRDLGFVHWRSWSWKKSWNRPSDYDLLNRLVRAGVEARYVRRILAISPPVGSTGLTGSAAHLALDAQRLKVGLE